MVTVDDLAVRWDSSMGEELRRLKRKQSEDSIYLFELYLIDVIDDEDKKSATLTNPTGLTKQQMSYFQQ